MPCFLTVDGIVGEETWNYLYKGSDSLPKLSIGSHGSVVQALQEALKAGGYYSGTVDGVFEAKTENAVRAFQAEHYLVSNGIIESRTWRMLEQARSSCLSL